MSTGLIIPASFEDALRIIEDLEPGSTESYSAALGGVELYELTVVPTWAMHLHLFCPLGRTRMRPPNRRAQWFVPDRRIRGDALFTGVEGDLPIGFLNYLHDEKLLGSVIEI